MIRGAAKLLGTLPLPRARGPMWVWVVVSAVLVLILAYMRLVVFSDRIVPLMSAVVLLVCLWHRDVRLLWGMATACVAMLVFKAAFMIPGLRESDDRVLFAAMQAANTVIAAAVIHAAIRLAGRVERTITILEHTNTALEASNEELAARKEEITQQNEELQVQSEELEQLTEELSSQMEELYGLNEQLAQRERSLADLLELSAGGADEREILEKLGETIRRALGDRAAGAAVLELAQPDDMAVDPIFGVVDTVNPVPRSRTLADLTLNRGVAGSLADVKLRTDVVAPKLANGAQVQSIAAAPLLLNGEPTGALEVYSAQAGEWSTHDLRLVQWLADQCGRMLTTVRLTAERELWLEAEHRARQSAEAANRAKDEFVATLSHELRTPLTAVLGWAALLKKSSGDASDEIRKGIDVIERNARRQGQLISDLLDISGIVAGKTVLEKIDVDLARLIENEVESIRPTAEAKGIELQCAIDDIDRAVFGDPRRLQQVVWNLLSNAVKFTARGGSVCVTAARVASYVQVRVADTGEGIAPEVLPLLFERYRQGDGSVTRRHGGLGLGLTIVKTLVELHGGTIDARSQGPGKGSTFTVLLPVHAARSDRGPSATPGVPSIDQERDAPTLDGISILVVDDEADARDLISHILCRRGAKVTVAESAMAALEIATSLRPDVVVSDIGMPGMDGCTLIRTLRERWSGETPQPAAIALTAFARAEERADALSAGFQRHLAKPVEAEELVSTIVALRRTIAAS